jgi:hypothetical protein
VFRVSNYTNALQKFRTCAHIQMDIKLPRYECAMRMS